MTRTIPSSIRQLRKQIRARVQPLFARIVYRLAPRLTLRERLRVRERLAHVMPLDYAAHPIRLHVNGLLEADVRTQSCAKEPGTVAWIENHLRPGDVLYDIGANVGAYALIAAKHVSNQATILAFEPGFENFAQLSRNVLLNDTQASVIPLAIPLAGQTGLSDFHLASLTSGGAMHSFGRALDYRGECFTPAASLRTVGWRLDDLVIAGPLPAPTLLKIDVDGLEQEILEGAVQVLARGTVRGVLVEINEERTEQCAAIIGLLHSADMRPVEKHHLVKRLYNYAFARGARASPLTPDEVPVTSSRHADLAAPAA